jgi:Ca-activated chloride channel family protein
MRALWAMAMIAAGILLPAGSGARAGQVELKVAVSHPVLLAGQKQTAYLKVGLTGVPLAVAEKRAPVNVALVLDRSGSMSGDKIRRAKEAAILAIHQLGPDDIVSVVAYNHGVTVLVPATKVSDRHVIYSAIDRLHADGTTALFAGVSKGAHEVRKFLSEDRVNRVILLSDGLANVGPSSPQALAALGASLIKEGISVTTIGLGLGYNEDLMFQLAHASEGNHVFVESSAHLARIFTREFGDLLSVVANEVEVEITCAEGIRPVRVLGRAADISGQRVTS